MRENRRPGSLASAQALIAALSEQLDVTLELTEHLTQTGRPDLALRLIHEQERALHRLPDQIAAGICGERPRARDHSRTRVAAVVAAFAVGATALGIGSGGSGTAEARILSDAVTQLDRAERIADPAARLERIARIYLRTRDLPDEVIARSGFGEKLATEAERTRDQIEDNPRSDPSVLENARQLAHDTAHDAPGAPAPPHSTNKSPAEDAEDQLGPH